MRLKKILAVMLAFVMALSSVTVAFAANGPNRYLGYILVYSSDYSTEVYLINNYTSDPVGTIKGATYDKSTNTLTLDNFNNPKLSITTNTMGDDFKINLIGENHIQYIGIWGDGHGGSCEFTGSGKLFVNENKLVKRAIYIAPEGASSVIKAGGSVTITAYAPDGGNSLYVNGTDDRNCIVGNASVAPKIENAKYEKGISVITSIDPDSDIYDVYQKQGSTNKFAVKIDAWSNATYIYLYQIVENPDDGTYILCPNSTGRYGAGFEFNPSDFGLTKTDETVEARETYYSSYEYLWHDKDGNEYVFSRTMDWDTFEYYYQQCDIREFVEAENANGEIVKWYKSTPIEDAEKYADEAAVEQAGFAKTTGIIEGLYIITVTASPYTLKGAAHTHSYKNVVKPATLSKNGTITPTCSCGATKSATAIAYPKTITLSAASYVYDGKVKAPKVTVKDSKGKAIAASNYTVTYASGRKNVGKYAVKITFKGNYSGTKTLYFTIVPKGTTIASLTAGSKAMTVKWKKQATQTTGYQIQYSTDANFKKGNKTVNIGSSKTISKKITKLTGKKKYYVRVRTYKKVGSTTYYSAWSAKKNVVTKK